MELIKSTEQIERIYTEKEKERSVRFLRSLWRECFEDSVSYENFYFADVYAKNVVYAIRDMGMLHLNPYLCYIRDEERLLHYIVGVGTHFSQRRKGIMRKLLNQALCDMYENGEPFTYLMPADVRYYEPFSFVSISDKKEKVWQEKNAGNSLHQNADHGRQKKSVENTEICYAEYEQIVKCWSDSEREQLYHKIQDILKERYDIFAKHDEAYFKLLAKEKGCQNGKLVFCFQNHINIDNLIGFFAYGREEEEAYVEQIVFLQDASPDVIRAAVLEYIKDVKKVIVAEQFPYMMRVLRLEDCIRLFGDKLYSYAAKGTRIRVTDEILTENNGIYELYLKDNQVCINKQSVCIGAGDENKESEGAKWDIWMPIEELSRLLFGKAGQNRVFFAEIV